MFYFTKVNTNYNTILLVRLRSLYVIRKTNRYWAHMCWLAYMLYIRTNLGRTKIQWVLQSNTVGWTYRHLGSHVLFFHLHMAVSCAFTTLCVRLKHLFLYFGFKCSLVGRKYAGVYQYTNTHCHFNVCIEMCSTEREYII